MLIGKGVWRKSGKQWRKSEKRWHKKIHHQFLAVFTWSHGCGTRGLTDQSDGCQAEHVLLPHYWLQYQSLTEMIVFPEHNADLQDRTFLVTVDTKI
jgi:hypothetical protein